MNTKPLYYVCSPYRADTETGMKVNQKKADFYKRQIEKLYGCRVVAPHTVLPDFLDDTIERERKLALKFGLDLIEVCDAIVVCGNEISEGMKNEIEKAEALGKDVFYEDFDIAGKKPYNVLVKETLSRYVVIYADDEDEAFELAEELCNKGCIDLNGSDFDDRYIATEGEADSCSIASRQVFCEEDI